MHGSSIPLFKPSNSSSMTLACARVSGRSGQWIFLESDASAAPTRALRAHGCLIDPACGDLVLVCERGAGAESFVLAVLACSERDRIDVVLPRGAALQEESGALRLVATQLDFEVREQWAVKAHEINMQGASGNFRFGRLMTIAHECRSQFGAVTIAAQSVSSKVGRLIQMARNCIRRVEELDDTHSGRMRVRVDERMQLQAKHANLVAQGRVKIDGEKIDLG